MTGKYWFNVLKKCLGRIPTIDLLLKQEMKTLNLLIYTKLNLFKINVILA